jgi:hypothetical protein
MTITKRSLRLSTVLALGLWSLGTGACSQPHLSKHYGQSYSAWFSAQHVPARPDNPSARHSIETLDAGEASMVSKNYRHTVSGTSGGGEPTQGRQILMVAPRAGETYMPPPSVPGGQ